MNLWNHMPPDEFRRVPAGLCDCDALAWSSAAPRPHDPALCVRWREVAELRALFALSAMTTWTCPACGLNQPQVRGPVAICRACGWRDPNTTVRRG